MNIVQYFYLSCFLLVSMVYFASLLREPRLVFNPVIWVGFWVLIRLSTGAAFWYPDYNFQFVNQISLRLYTILYPLICLFLGGMLIALGRGRKLSYSGVDLHDSSHQITRVIFWVAFFGSLIGFVALLKVRPWEKTGLYAVLFEPSLASLFREETIKVLPSSLNKSIYVFTSSVLVPIGVAALAALWRPEDYRTKKWVYILFILFFCVVVGINGARAPAAKLILLAFIVLAYRDVYSLRLRSISYAAVLILILVLLLTIARSNVGDGDQLEIVLSKLSQILRRAFGSTFETGLWHVEYANKYGLWSFNIFGFPMKGIFGFEHVNHFRVVGEWYANIYNYKHTTTNMNTSFIFVQETVWGAFGGKVFSIIFLVAISLIPLSLKIFPDSVRVWLYPLILWYLIDCISTSFVEIFWKILLIEVLVFLCVVLFQVVLISVKTGGRPGVVREEF